MKKQMITLMAVAMFATTITVASVRAQNAGNFAVTIPFAFAAAGKTLPAGDYYVRRRLNGAQVVMRIESKKGWMSIYVPTHGVQSTEIQNESKLVFNKYGEQFFLSQVWVAGRSSGEELNKTSRERILQRELALRVGKLETITIAARGN